ncbi:aminotransferase class V-fold PLP-dependent enzyme [Streptomyces sp. NPDC058155]|uniref:aminotransferase class V-fold PLP-dependent enzyme n=1 Tax=Streptomyces sp. NPDC058155 TaxID=3346359 RepID=UPI0036F18B7E
MPSNALSRRAILQRSAVAGGVLSLGPLLGGATEALAQSTGGTAAAADKARKDVYGRIGVRPLINGRGTYTIISGSLMLPEVREAIDAAARQYVHLDELADAVGKRLAKITKAEHGLVASGCHAALTHATTACVAGGNPDLHVRLPDLTGFQKTEVIIPAHSRNVYENAVSAVGVKVVEVSTPDELKRAIGPRTALIYIMAGPRVDESELPTDVIASIAGPEGVPVLVDAAAEILTVPNVHLERGADLVAYSGGKAMRGPQSAGLLLGREDLVRAAWVSSAPHHGIGRGYKVGKEEAMGMLAAVEMWVRRDHDAEYARWESWLKTIARRVSAIGSVKTEVTQPDSLSNRTPSLAITWNHKGLGVSGKTVVDTLYEAETRIAINTAGSDDPERTGVSITPYMLQPGEERTIADALVRILTDPPAPPAPPRPPSVDATGEWTLEIEYLAGSSTAHRLELAQDGAAITGTHTGEYVSRKATGSVSGKTVTVRSTLSESSGDALDFTFTGTLQGDSMSGELNMGEYLKATWKAERGG